MVYCLNPHCQRPLNPDGNKFCQHCGTALVTRLRDRYRVMEPIGQGGFGRTYLAIDEDRLKQKCVIKQFSPQLNSTKAQSDSGMRKYVSLFEEEAQRLHELGEHPQIPTLFAYFSDQQQLYLVQQFVEGRTLGEEVAQGGFLDEDQVRQLLLDLLPVLQFIHDRQVIHRDIKPDNILRPSNGKRPFLIDFGVAKVISSEINRGGTKVGTEGYAPLEQLRSGQAYPASDLYSLGATCLFLLSGQPPEELYDPMAGAWIWRTILARDGVRVSDSFGLVLDRMLHDRVADRYQSAERVLADLKSGEAPKPKASGAGVAMTPQMALEEQSWACVQTLSDHSDRVQSVQFSQDGRWLVSSSGDKSIKVWNWSSGELMTTMTGHKSRVNALALTPDSQTIISGSSDRQVRAWDLATGDCRWDQKKHQDWVTCLALSPDGKWVASGGDDGRIIVWDVESGEAIAQVRAQNHQICALAFSHDGQYLASGGQDSTVQVWMVMPALELAITVDQHVGRVTSLVYSPDGQWLISGGEDSTIKLWPLDHKRGLPLDKPVCTFSEHEDSVFALAISQNGRLLVSGSKDQTMKLWYLPTRHPLKTLSGHSWWVNSVAIAPDGTTLASGSGDQSIRIWQIAP